MDNWEDESTTYTKTKVYRVVVPSVLNFETYKYSGEIPRALPNFLSTGYVAYFIAMYHLLVIAFLNSIFHSSMGRNYVSELGRG